MAGADCDAALAAALAEEDAAAAYGGYGAYDASTSGASDADPDYGAGAAAAAKRRKPAAARRAARTAGGGGGGGGGAEAGASVAAAAGTSGPTSAAGAPPRAPPRAWTPADEAAFEEGIRLHGRNWRAVAARVGGGRDAKAVASHAQKWLVKALLRGEALPPAMAASGEGYTLSGRPLDPSSASARAYGLRPALFAAVVERGALIAGVHVTTLEMEEVDGEGGGGGGRAAAARPSAAPAAPATAKRGRPPKPRPPPATPAPPPPARPRRAAAAAAASRLGATSESLALTEPGAFAAAGALAQPFAVALAPQALLVADFHAHLSLCEVAGLLGGAFDPAARALTIAAAFPCARVGGGAGSATSVELDPASQVAAMQAMGELGLTPVGWYHSHPTFPARPSVTDNGAQRNGQALARDAASGLEPWVGVIVGPYAEALPSPASQVCVWVTRTRGGGGGGGEAAAEPFALRCARGAAAVPPAGGAAEAALGAALAQAARCAGRVGLAEPWRAFSFAAGGGWGGPPLSRGAKLRAALAAHLPADAPAEVAAFFRRLEALVEAAWGERLAPSSPFELPPAPGGEAAAVEPAAEEPAAVEPAVEAPPAEPAP
jgi:proteasome lid subunit RPN8/RPN11